MLVEGSIPSGSIAAWLPGEVPVSAGTGHARSAQGSHEQSERNELRESLN